ncbi:MAG: hypothetical protein SXU28_15240, partial [Pseudomonadota bacterium]|nr:hypothetical protein [Pseudomonadota bacterium]
HLADVIASGEATDETYKLQLELMLKLGDGDLAMRALDQLSHSALSGRERRVAEANAYILQGRAEKAADLYNGSDPAELSADDLHMVLWSMLEIGNEEGFDTGMDFALTAFPEDADINILAGKRVLALGLTDEASRYAATAHASDPDNYEGALLSGEAAIARGELETALGHYEKARELFPTRAIPAANIAGLQLDLGQIEAAGKTISEGLAIDAELPFLQWQRARHALKTEDLETAREALEKARRTFRTNDAFTLLSAQVEDALGNKALALSEYKRYLSAVGSDQKVEARVAQLEM